MIATIFTVFWWAMPGAHSQGAGHWQSAPVKAVVHLDW